MIKWTTAIVIGLLIGSQLIAADTLSEDLLVERILASYPEIKIALDKIEQQRGKARSKLSFFDTKIDAKSTSRTEGYYDGDWRSATVRQNLPLLNTSMYGGFRQSNGDLPVYEDQFATLSDGEAFVGIDVSLLRDFKSTEELTELRNARLAIDIAKQKAKLKTLSVVNKGRKLYWKWLLKGETMNAYQRLLSVAITRQDALKTLVSNGDKPRAYLIENQQYVNQRESDMLLSQRELQQLANQLTLYNRNKKGHTIQVTLAQLPKIPNPFNNTPPQVAKVDSLTWTNHPYLRQLAFVKKQLKNELALQNNAWLPAIDIGVQLSDDRGTGGSTRAEQETKVNASVKIPLQQRKVRGETMQLKAAISQVDRDYQFVLETLQQDYKTLGEQLELTQKAYSLRNEAQRIAKKLYAQENQRFEAGDSDFFRINVLEQNLIKATLDFLKISLERQELIIDYELFIKALTTP